MDVRIGLIQNAKELELQLEDDADAGGAPRAGARPPSQERRHALAHRPQGPPGGRGRREAGLRRDRQPRRRPPHRLRELTGPRPVPVDLLDRKLLFVTGKGGVGKTTIAASLALLASQHGKRTLVGEVDAKGNLADFFEIGPTSFKEREVAPGLFAMSMDTEESLKEYLSLQLKIPLVARLGPLARTFDFVANAAPGREGDPHDRQVPVGGARAQLRPRRRRRGRHRPHHRPARRPAGDPGARAGRAWCATRPAGCSTCSATRPRPAW